MSTWMNEFNETALLEKRVLDIRKELDFEIKKLAEYQEYHDLYLKIDRVLMGNILENFRKICLKNLSFRSYKILLAPGLVWL